MISKRSILVLAAALSAVACSTPPASAPAAATAAGIPAYLASATGCAVVAGGDIGSRFTDRQVTTMWARINAAVTTELHDRLVAGQYKAVKYLVPAERDGKAEDLVFEHLALNRCNRVLQVSHKVDEDAQGRYFRFDVALFRARPKDPAAPASAQGTVTVVATREFERSYRFPRTQEAFDNFYTGTFAEKVLGDLQAAGVLGPLRAAAAP